MVGSAVAADPTGRHGCDPPCQAGRLSPGREADCSPGARAGAAEDAGLGCEEALLPQACPAGPWPPYPGSGRAVPGSPLLDARNAAHRGPAGLYLKGTIPSSALAGLCSCSYSTFLSFFCLKNSDLIFNILLKHLPSTPQIIPDFPIKVSAFLL